MKNLTNIDFLLFDLGNVIINIDYSFTINELKNRLPEDKHGLTETFYPAKFHKDYEKGLIDTSQFRNEVKNHFEVDWSNDEIDFLWNSLLKDIPTERIDLIRNLSGRFQLGVLSNTNELHIQALDQILERDFQIPSLNPLFDHVFYSHDLNLAKPDPAIYEKVIELIGVSPEKILFFDDLKENLLGAEQVGYQTYHIDHPKALIHFFKDVQ
ncbi:HAD family hydrolase [Belliella pelovolcani]|nr:HAD family phosphatase [Belliella pelovolcani]